MTVAEVSAVGLPAVYVPLPHGNGEQALNAAPVVAAGGGVLVPDAELTGERVLAELVPLLADPARLAATGTAARASGHADADERLADVIVLDVVAAPVVTAPPSVPGRWGAGAPGRHRRGRDERHRPDPARPRGRRSPGRTPRTRARARAAGARRAGRRSATTRRTCPPAGHASSCPRRSARPTRSWSPPASAACPWCTGPHALAALTAGRRVAGVAGTHGKTSTTLDAHRGAAALRARPVVRDRRRPDRVGRGAHHGAGDIFVAEADESDGSFLAFAPHVAVVTNVEPDHLDHHGTAEAYRGRVRRSSSTGSSPAARWSPAPTTRASPRSSPGAPRTGGVTCAATAQAAAVPTPCCSTSRPAGAGARVRARLGGDELVLRLAVPGEHMVLNALGAVAGRRRAGRARRLPGRAGSPRSTGCGGGSSSRAARAASRVYDDYAHHPTEVAAQLRAAPGGRPAGGRLVVAFQPHLYSPDPDVRRRVRRRARLADEVVVLDVYGAREDPEPGVTGALVADAVPLPPEQVHYVPRWAEVPAVLAGSPARVTWCSRWARATSPSSARRCCGSSIGRPALRGRTRDRAGDDGRERRTAGRAVTPPARRPGSGRRGRVRGGDDGGSDWERAGRGRAAREARR